MQTEPLRTSQRHRHHQCGSAASGFQSKLRGGLRKSRRRKSGHRQYGRRDRGIAPKPSSSTPRCQMPSMFAPLRSSRRRPGCHHRGLHQSHRVECGLCQCLRLSRKCGTGNRRNRPRRRRLHQGRPTPTEPRGGVCRSRRCRRYRGDVDDAIADFTKAIRVSPGLAKAYLDRGAARHAKGDLAGAIADYNKSIQLNPNDPIAYADRSAAKRAKGDLDGAVADSLSAAKLRAGQSP